MKIDDPKWTARFLGIASEVATWSKDTTKVGAVIVSDDGLNISTGYNGPPRGVRDLPERFERPRKYLWAVHAEAAAIANAARYGVATKGATLFCTHSPCASCARLMLNAGITCVVVGPGRTHMDPAEFEAAREMFAEAMVEVRPYPSEVAE